jgi:hypothetical protein
MILTAERPATNLFGPLLHFDPFVGTIRVSIGPMTDRKTPRGNVRVEAKVRYVVVPQVNSKAVEKASGKSSLTPCILDDDPAQLEM